jgi:hypothetical protein
MTNLIYINTEYDSIASIGLTMNDALVDFGNISWRDLFERIMGHDLSQKTTRQLIKGEFGVHEHEYSDVINEDIVERFYADISYYIDFQEGPAAQAYTLVREANVLAVNSYGCGSSHGVELFMETANGPSKQLIIHDQAGALWLSDLLRAAGNITTIVFV